MELVVTGRVAEERNMRGSEENSLQGQGPYIYSSRCVYAQRAAYTGRCRPFREDVKTGTKAGRATGPAAGLNTVGKRKRIRSGTGERRELPLQGNRKGPSASWRVQAPRTPARRKDAGIAAQLGEEAAPLGRLSTSLALAGRSALVGSWGRGWVGGGRGGQKEGALAHALSQLEDRLLRRRDRWARLEVCLPHIRAATLYGQCAPADLGQTALGGGGGTAVPEKAAGGKRGAARQRRSGEKGSSASTGLPPAAIVRH